MKRIFAFLPAALALGVLAAPSLADMTIKLKDGRTITLPVDPQDLNSVTFGPSAPNAGEPAGSSIAAIPSPPAAPAPLAPASQAGSGAGLPSVSGIPATPARPRSSGRVLQVGPSRELKTPSAAAAIAQNGDTIAIDAVNYVGDVAVWKADDLVIRGIGGRAHIEADGEAAQGKAIWVTAGKNTDIENIEFSGAKVGDGNGAGIRAEGANLTIFSCYFHDNQEGILAGDNPESDIVIDSSAFVRNGTDTGKVHGIYINHVRTLLVRGSVFEGTSVGHHIKSRAEIDYILYNRILDLADGTASYSIDLSNGGRGYIIGNVIEKGPKAQNYNFIAMAMEGPTNSFQELYVIGNTMVLDRSSGVFVHSRSPGPVLVADNILSGPGDPLQGSGKLIHNVIANPSGSKPGYLDDNGGGGNIVVRDAGFVDPAKYDYHLKPGSPAIGAGVDPGQAEGVKLLPDYQNLYPLGTEPRPPAMPPDDGAYRFASAAR